MSMIERALSRLGFEKRGNNGDPYWENFAALRTGGVTPSQAEGVSAVLGCVEAISGTVASLPLHLYRRTDSGREKASDHALYKVLHHEPNSRQTALEFRELMMAAVLLRGNAFARITRGYDGQVRALDPIHPDRVRVLDLKNGRIGYEISNESGTSQLTQDEVFHVRHRSDDGVIGISPIARAKEVIELAMAERDHGVDTFRNGAKLLGILKAPGRLNADQRAKLRESWAAYKAGHTPVLDDGVDFSTVSMTLEDAEWIAARRYSTEEVARIFRVPPTLIGDLSHANYSNSVEMNRWFLTHGLRRHLVAWEQAIGKQLLTEQARRTYFAEHNVEGMLRGDSKHRAEFYRLGVQDGWLNVDEVRQLENMPRMSNGRT